MNTSSYLTAEAGVITATLTDLADSLNRRHSDVKAMVDEHLLGIEGFGTCANFKQLIEVSRGEMKPVDTYLLDERQALIVGCRIDAILAGDAVNKLRMICTELDTMKLASTTAALEHTQTQLEEYKSKCKQLRALIEANSASNFFY